LPNIASLLKDEITRLCRKELRAQLDPVRNASAGYRKEIAQLKRRIDQLERQGRKLQKQVPPAQGQSIEEDRKLRFVAKGLVSLRKRLGLSIEAFAKLLHVSPQSIYNWQTGKTTPQRAQLEKLASIRSLGKREAAALLNAAD